MQRRITVGDLLHTMGSMDHVDLQAYTHAYLRMCGPLAPLNYSFLLGRIRTKMMDRKVSDKIFKEDYFMQYMCRVVRRWLKESIKHEVASGHIFMNQTIVPDCSNAKP